MPQVQPLQPAMPSGDQITMNSLPNLQQVQPTPVIKKDNSGLIKTIIIIALSLALLTFVGLFVWMTLQYNEVSGDVQDKIDMAVAVAKDEQAVKMENAFLEREKYPYKTFSGPVDYGELTFEYPKTWSVYVAADASSGGEFSAYLNPGQVDAIGRNTLSALEVKIVNKGFDNVVSEYQRALESKNSGLTVESIVVNGTTANKYSGKIPNTEFNGYIVIFKIRDKTAILQTDSVFFKDDFDKIISTITFNV